MDSVYSVSRYGSVLPSSMNAPYQQYQMSSTPEVMSHYPPSLEPGAAVPGPPPPLSSFFGYSNNIDVALNGTNPIGAAVSGIKSSSDLVHGDFWPHPPPPPPPLLYSAPYNAVAVYESNLAPLQSCNFTTGDVATSSSYNSVTAGVSRINDYRTIIQPPPPPPFLFSSSVNKYSAESPSTAMVSPSKKNHPAEASANSNEDFGRRPKKRSRFTGKICDLPENSRRPQVSEGRTFPLKVHGEYLRSEAVKLGEKDSLHPHHYNGLSYQQSGTDFNDGTDEPVILTATKFVRKLPLSHSSAAITVALNESASSKGNSISQLSPRSLDSRSGRSSAEIVSEPVPGTSEERSASSSSVLKRATSSGTLSRNGMSWRRRTSADDPSEKAEGTSLIQKKRGSFRLRRIKDQVYTEDSNECFEFAEHGSCRSGVFCIYDHAGDSSHRTAKICARLLKGRCRKANCKYPHLLQSHQMPVCDYYIRRMCTKEDCQFLHVKHSDSAKPCEQFNRGICKLGDDCSHPHRYYRAVIAKRGQDNGLIDGSNTDTVSNDNDDEHDDVDDGDIYGTDDRAVNASVRSEDNGLLFWPI